MNKGYQTIQVNVGLNWTQGNDRGQFDRELGRFLVETKFPHTGIVSEPYVSNWTDSNGVTYEDGCVAFKITVPRLHAMPIGEIERRLETIRVILKQDAIAFTTTIETGDSVFEYSDVYYGDDRPEDSLTFNSEYFHYIK